MLKLGSRPMEACQEGGQETGAAVLERLIAVDATDAREDERLSVGRELVGDAREEREGCSERAGLLCG